MISAEMSEATLIELRTELENRGWQPDSRGDADCVDQACAMGADAVTELLAARTRIAELINEVAAHHFVRNERDRLLEQLRAQGLSQEDREACLAGAEALESDNGRDMTDDLAHAAILRRLGGQTT